MGRAPCCDKSKVKRGPWSTEEDTTLTNYLHKHGIAGSWIALPQKAGLKRCGKSCRLRWLNYLRPNIKHGGFTNEEDTIILSLYHTIGSRWSVIASQLPGRTDNDVKNHWNTKLKKKLFATAGATNLRSSAAAATSSFISTTNSDMEAAYSRNSEYSDYMLPYFPIDDVIDSQIPLPALVEASENDFTALPSVPATLSPPFSADKINANEFGCGLMPHDLINAFDFHEKFNQDINYPSFGYSPSTFSNAELEQMIYQSFTY